MPQYQIFDLHCDAILRCYYYNKKLKDDNTFMHTDVPKIKEGNVKAIFMALFPEQAFQGPLAVSHIHDLINLMMTEIEENTDTLHLCLNKNDIEQAQKQNKTQVILSIEGGHGINNSLQNLEDFYNKGVRSLTLTHVSSNEWAESSNELQDNKGLTGIGPEVISFMNQNGMVIDVAHTSEQTVLDVAKITKAPIIASHTFMRHICNNERGITDTAMKAIKDTGGVVGLMLYPPFFDNKSLEHFKPMLNELIEHLKNPPQSNDPKVLAKHDLDAFLNLDTTPFTIACVKDFMPQFKYAIDLIGEDHVALGSDFDGINFGPKDMPHSGKFNVLANAMKDFGFDETVIQKVLFKNASRVVGQVM